MRLASLVVLADSKDQGPCFNVFFFGRKSSFIWRQASPVRRGAHFKKRWPRSSGLEFSILLVNRADFSVFLIILQTNHYFILIEIWNEFFDLIGCEAVRT